MHDFGSRKPDYNRNTNGKRSYSGKNRLLQTAHTNFKGLSVLKDCSKETLFIVNNVMWYNVTRNSSSLGNQWTMLTLLKHYGNTPHRSAKHLYCVDQWIIYLKKSFHQNMVLIIFLIELRVIRAWRERSNKRGRTSPSELTPQVWWGVDEQQF